MIKIIISLLLLSINAFAGDIVISKDTTVNNTWNIPATTIVRFETGGKISGTGILSGGIIDAPYTQHIFDTTLTVIPSGVYARYFSARWFGAHPSRQNNYTYLQKSINACLGNKFIWYLPLGKYTYTQTLHVAFLYQGTYAGVSIHMVGESNYWDASNGSILEYVPTAIVGSALGLHQNKGTEIEHLTIRGGWRSPSSLNKMTYFNIPYADYQDVSGKNYDAEGYRGLAVDCFNNPDGSSSGSSGIYVHDVFIGGFGALITISRNGSTLNADALTFERLQFGDARTGFISTQGQEKGNIIRGLVSWASIHTLFSSGQHLNGQGGGYTIDGANIAGGCVRLFNITQRGWNVISISNLFAEQIATIGNVSSDVTLAFNACTFDFAYPSEAGKQTLLKSSGKNIMFMNSTFRYFGQSDAMKFEGVASYINYFWSGPYQNVNPNGKVQPVVTTPLENRGKKIEL